MSHIVLFAVTALIAVAIPGPDFFLVFQTSLRHGGRAGVLSACGIGTGLIVHGTAATLGLSALMLKSAQAFEIVKYLGAIYLVYLAVQLVIDLVRKRSEEQNEMETTDVQGSNVSYRKFVVRGFLTNVLNVKAALYFVAIVPQFIDTQQSAVSQFAIISIIQIVIAIAWFSTVAIAVNKLGVFLKRRVIRRWLDGATAAIFLALAAKLASTSRH